jgi:hypothetical protein
MKKVNSNKELNLIHIKPRVRWWAIFAILGIVLTFTACSNDDDIAGVEEHPSLKVENDLNDSWRSITRVSLVGYTFSNLNIEPYGGFQTFTLDEGMSGGYEDINITVRYIRNSGISGYASIKVNFSKGETTTIVLTGCSGAEGCPGIYLEQR